MKGKENITLPIPLDFLPSIIHLAQTKFAIKELENPKQVLV